MPTKEVIVLTVIEHMAWIIEIKQPKAISIEEIEFILRVRPLEYMSVIVESDVLRITMLQIRC